MQTDLSNNRPIHIDIRRRSTEIPRPHLNPHISLKNLSVYRRMRTSEEIFMAQLSDLVAVRIVDEPTHLDIHAVSPEVEDGVSGGVFEGAAEGP